MGIDDRDYMRERRLRFPDVTPRRPWWHKWQSWLGIAVAVVGLASATMWLVRDVGRLVPDFGPKSGSLVVNINTATAVELETVPGIGPNQVESLRPFLTVAGETRKRER
jgi:hypothetical protein